VARIILDHLAHSYSADPRGPSDYALKEIDHVWEQGGAYALLGPSGCGKTTLLNIISGLVIPTRGRILFDGRDVTTLPTESRNIAQVFQLPVVIFVLARIGLVTPRFLIRHFKYAVLIAFVVAAIITPTPDVVTQSLLALPMLGLYLLGVLVAWLFGRPRQVPVSAEARTPAVSPE